MTASSATWPRDSLQYIERVNSIRDMLIQTGMPVTYVNKACVHKMFHKFDPKFAMPGMKLHKV